MRVHTYKEAEVLDELVTRILCDTAPPLHQLRAFISCVSVVRRGRAKVHIFNFVGLPQRWEDHVVHSQGVQRGTRSGLIHKELKKIERYFKKDDLVSPREVLKYMDRRDG